MTVKITWKCKECENENTVIDSWDRSIGFRRTWRKLICPKCKVLTWHRRFNSNSDYYLETERKGK